jgi:hypothetical protein
MFFTSVKKTFYGLRGCCVGSGNFNFSEVSIRSKGGETPASQKSSPWCTLAGAAYCSDGLSDCSTGTGGAGSNLAVDRLLLTYESVVPTRPRTLRPIACKFKGPSAGILGFGHGRLGRAALVFARAIRLRSREPIQKCEHAFVADLLFAQRQGVDHLPQRPAVFLGPLAADDAFVFGHAAPHSRQSIRSGGQQP